MNVKLSINETKESTVTLWATRVLMTYDPRRNLTTEILNNIRALQGITIVNIEASPANAPNSTSAIVELKIKLIPSPMSIEGFHRFLFAKIQSIRGIRSFKFIGQPKKII